MYRLSKKTCAVGFLLCVLCVGIDYFPENTFTFDYDKYVEFMMLINGVDCFCVISTLCLKKTRKL